MTLRFVAALLSMVALSPGMVSAQSYQPSFRPDALQDRPAGRPNEVLVVGSPHLSYLPDSFTPEMVEPILQRLVEWRPTAVASENISGLQCDAMRRQGERHAEAVEAYCYDPAAAGRAAGLDVTAANAEAERMLANWPATPSAAQRRRLALVFLAAGEPASATVQWFRLPDAERRVDQGLTDELVAYLQAQLTRKSETELIAAQLAARSGLERVWSVDDQSFVGAPVDEQAYGEAIERAWDNPANKARIAADQALYAGIGQPDGLLDIYRALNAPSLAALAYESDWGAALVEPSEQAYGRRYVAYWETRNLRMVANIREVLGRAPGTRLVTIVGASHKAYYEAYLNQMRDVTLVDVMPVLSATPSSELPPRQREWEHILADYDGAAREEARKAQAVTVPEVYELATIILALTPGGEEYMAKTPYAEEVKRHFGPFRDHPVVAASGLRSSDDWSAYYDFRENAYAYCFDDEKGDPNRLWRCARFSHVWGRQANSFASNLDLIEDFARVSGFRAFYKAHRPHYANLEYDLSRRADVAAMIRWLDARFPVRVDVAQVVFSPLTDGSHSTQRFADAGGTSGEPFVSVALFVQPVSDVPISEAYRVERMLFTELDHNYVNFTLDAFEKELNEGIFSNAYWKEEQDAGAYESGFDVFAEYMTWALFELYARDGGKVPYADLKEHLDQRMTRRGFIRYRAFADETIRLYDNAAQAGDGPVQIPSLYPGLIAWGQAQLPSSSQK